MAGKTEIRSRLSILEESLLAWFFADRTTVPKRDSFQTVSGEMEANTMCATQPF